jgi:CRP-like cAMP-binding protein
MTLAISSLSLAGNVAAADRLSNRLLASLSPPDLALLAPLRESLLQRGTVLQDSGGAIEHVYFPLGGMISLVVRMQSGEMVEVATIGRDAALGTAVAFGSRRAVGTAIVQLPGLVARIPCSQFEVAARRSSAIRELAAACNDLLIGQIQQSVACNTLHDAEARLCRWLLQASDIVGGDMIPLTQDFLAQMLGVRRTTVTIIARLLQDRGLIRYRRGQIQIVDRAVLEKGACECYRAVRDMTERVLHQESGIGNQESGIKRRHSI